MTWETRVANSPRYEARLGAAWRDFYATADALHAELVAVSPRARQKALGAIVRVLRLQGLEHLPLVQATLADLRKAAGLERVWQR